ncbi:MAG: LysR substrate-binding domain-containing protein [Pseudohongiellaceae bacterium]
MASIDLNDYYYFVHVVEKGGFTRAAESLGIPKSRLSRHIAQLETRLDTILIQRTTRQSKLTEIGEAFYQRASAVVEQVELAEAEAKREKNILHGKVTLSCSVGVAQFALKELIARFMVDNPGVSVFQQVTNQNIDLITSGVDMSIRGHIDPLPDSSLIPRLLAVVEWNLFTSPAYLSNEEPIAAPVDLRKHQTLSLGWQAPSDVWKLEHKTGTQEDIQITPRLKSEDMTTLKNAASEGLGIVALPSYTCREEMVSGQLVRVLPQWSAGQAKLSLIMPRRKGFAAPVVALQEFLQAEMADFVAIPKIDN